MTTGEGRPSRSAVVDDDKARLIEDHRKASEALGRIHDILNVAAADLKKLSLSLPTAEKWGHHVFSCIQPTHITVCSLRNLAGQDSQSFAKFADRLEAKS